MAVPKNRPYMPVWLSCADCILYAGVAQLCRLHDCFANMRRIRNAQVIGSVFCLYAGVAQLVEQRIRNAQVIGSSPITSFRKLRFKTGLFSLPHP